MAIQCRTLSLLYSWLFQHSIDCPTARESATRLLELAHRLYCSLLSTKLLHCATKLLAPSLCSLMNFAFSIKPSTLSNSKQLREMHEVAQNVWNAMCAQFMRSDQSSINESLELLARLLVSSVCDSSCFKCYSTFFASFRRSQ